jgi:hypothetical protein
MNVLEQFAITIVLGLLQMVIKNPAVKVELQTQLLGIAGDIYAAYGMTPPESPVGNDPSATFTTVVRKVG